MPLPSNDPENPQYKQWDRNVIRDYIYYDDPESWYIDNSNEFYRNYMIHASEWKMLNDEGSELYYKSIKPEWNHRKAQIKWNELHESYASYDPQKENWIYGFNLTERLFIPEKLDRLHDYYSKTPQQLAHEYISSPKNLSTDQIERLVHEIDPELRKMLENNLQPSNLLIKIISEKFTFKIQNGLKIFK